MPGSIWITWAALFLGAAVPFNRLLPWVTTRLEDLSATLDIPKTRCQKYPDTWVSIWVAAFSILKGLVASYIATTNYLPDWAQIVTLSIVVIGHSWTIFSPGSRPSPFWVIVGIFLFFDPWIAILFLGLFGLGTILINVPALAMILSTGVTATFLTSDHLVPDIFIPAFLGVLSVTLSAQLVALFDDIPPTLWGLFVQRK
ncbi:hypothetical protein EB093_02865 [bacterium]|nr:hypothetical protein [bacterium]